MALMFSGNRGVVQALKEFGADPEYCMGEWLGPWSNRQQIVEHLAWCKANGVKPAFQFFYWGDEICLEALKGLVEPRELGSGVVQTVGGYWGLLKLLAACIKEAGTQGALVSIESEWNKRGPRAPAGTHSVLDEPAVFDKLFADSAGYLHDNAPGTLVVTCPGSWGERTDALLGKFPRMVAATDYVATQGLNTLYGQTEAQFIASSDRFLARIQQLQTGGKGKPVLLMDVAWSSYGGSFRSTGNRDADHPFPPMPPATPPATVESNLRAGEAAQAKAIARFGELLPKLEAAGLRGVFYRGLKDARMDTKNYWGYFEWGWGVVRLDGSRKPAYDALMALARRKTYTAAEYDAAVVRAVQAEERAQAAIRDLGREREASQAALALADDLRRRAEAAQEILAGRRSP